MSTLTVLHDPSPELRVVSQPVSSDKIDSPEIQKLIADLVETMVLENGVGIAAPQVGVHERVIIVETGPGVIQAFINPEITERSFKLVNSEEGCLSVPGQWGIVKRHRGVTVKALNQQGKEVIIKATALPAIIFQHEIDHLDGVLFTDRALEMTTSASRL